MSIVHANRDARLPIGSLAWRLFRNGRGRARLGESPVWDAATGAVWWVDIDGRALLRTDPLTEETLGWVTPEIPGFVVLMGPDRAAVGMQTGIFSFDPRTSAFERIVAFDRPGQRFNDATVDPLGRLWTSTMALDAEPGCAAIQQVTGEMSLQTVVAGLAIPNGLAVDTGRGRFYYSDSHRDVQTIWVAPMRGGLPVAGEAAVFARTAALAGRPDGAALDERGFYWIAGVDGSEIYVFDPDGTLDEVIAVPVPAPTKPCFFGTEGRTIAVTSKGIGEGGGFLALAQLPQARAPGMVQPCWAAAARS